MNKLCSDLIKSFEDDPVSFKYMIYDLYGDNPVNANKINILGIRSNHPDTAFYNDVIIFFRFNGSMKICEATTVPGSHYLQKPLNRKGTAVLKEGYYPSIWTLGLHRQSYKALVQTGVCTVYRDNNKNSKIDDLTTLDTGYFGINCHRASATVVSKWIGLYSAGCQVFKDSKDFKLLIAECEKDVTENYAIAFDYLLVNSKNLKF